MKLSFTTLDVFTTTRYVGNPLAVVRVPASLRETLTESQKLHIAREFNLSETTFLHEPAPGAEVADFDIFTPKARMSFAGHPTIGTAIYVAQHAAAYHGIKALKTVAGTIPFKFDEATGTATVNIPHDVYTHKARLPHPSAAEGAEPSVPIVSIVKGMAFGLAQLVDLAALAATTGPLLPSAVRFKGEYLDAGSGWNVGYTGSFYYVDLGTEDEVRRLRTRSLPQHEDPGTGSASAALCCYIALQEGGKGERKFHLTQGVEMGRQCDIYVTVRVMGDGKGIDAVELSGAAVEVMEGTLVVE